MSSLFDVFVYAFLFCICSLVSIDFCHYLLRQFCLLFGAGNSPAMRERAVRRSVFRLAETVACELAGAASSVSQSLSPKAGPAANGFATIF